MLDYIVAGNKYVEPLYQMEKDGQLTGDGDKGRDALPFLDGQLQKRAR